MSVRIVLEVPDVCAQDMREAAKTVNSIETRLSPLGAVVMFQDASTVTGWKYGARILSMRVHELIVTPGDDDSD